MKSKKLFRTLMAVAVMFFAFGANAQLLLQENFNLTPIGGNVVGATGSNWAIHVGQEGVATTTFTIAAALEFPNYIASGSSHGNAARLETGTNAAFRNNLYAFEADPITSGWLYMAAMVNIGGTTFQPGGGLGFLGFTNNVSEGIRLWVGRDHPSPEVTNRPTTAGEVFFGINRTGTAGDRAMSSVIYDLGETVLLVMRVHIGSEAQPVELYINPVPGAPMPATPAVSLPAAASAHSITGIFTRTNQAGPVQINMGGIRVARTWEEAVAAAPPTGEPSLALQNLIVAETELPEQTFMGGGPFIYTLQHRNYDLTPAITINPLTPGYVEVTATHGTNGAAVTGPNWQIPMPAGVLTDTIVFTLTGTDNQTEIYEETETYLVIFQKDTVLPRITTVVVADAFGTYIPRTGNIVVTFNKPMTPVGALNTIATINGDPVTVEHDGAVLTIPYDANSWNELAMEVAIVAGSLRDAVLNPNVVSTHNFTQNMIVPNVTAVTVSGANLDGATDVPISVTIHLEFPRSDVVRNTEVNITLNGDSIPVTGTSIVLSGLDFLTEYTLNIPVGAFMVPTNNDLKSTTTVSADFETAGFQVVLGTYRPITGGAFRAFRNIVTNPETGLTEWARGEDAYSRDSVWFFTRRNDGTDEFPDFVFTIFGTPGEGNVAPPGTNTANINRTDVNQLALNNSMLSPQRFNVSTQNWDVPFVEPTTGTIFHANDKARLHSNAAAQFIFRVESTSISEITLNMIRNTGTHLPGASYTHISEIFHANSLHDEDWEWTPVMFATDSADIRGLADMDEAGPFMLRASNLNIPAGRFVIIRTSHSRMLVEALLTPMEDHFIRSITYTNAAGNVIFGDTAASNTFTMSVNFEGVPMERNPNVAVTLNGTPITGGTGTTIPVSGLTYETYYEILFPRGAFVGGDNNALRSQPYTVRFRTGAEEDPGTSILPEITTEQTAVSVFPNPVSDILYVEAENMRLIEIMDMFGRTVIRQAASDGRQNVDVSSLAEGLYFIRVTATNGEVVVTRFIKQ